MAPGAADPQLAAVAAFIADRGVLAPHEHVLALVSGGADSMFLLHALDRVHPGAVTVLTCNHGLRPEAAGECERVRREAARLGRDVVVVGLHMQDGAGVQARARAARYAAARRTAQERGCDVLATGHTADDQAETVLMRLARGAGTDGVRGMRPRRGDVARPLLFIARADARAWCRAQGVEFVDDPSNGDPRYGRVRARRLVAALEDVSPGATAHLAAFADLLADEAAVLASLADLAAGRCRRDSGWDTRALAAEPPAVQRILIRRLLADADASEDARGRRVVEDVRAALPDVARRDLAGGLVIGTVDGALCVTRPSARPEPAPRTLQPLVPGGRVAVGARAVAAHRAPAPPPGPGRIALPEGIPLTVRGSAPGDRIALEGGGRAHVRRVLAGARVPWEERHEVPVVFAGGELVWIAGHRFVRAALARTGEPAIVLRLEDA